MASDAQPQAPFHPRAARRSDRRTAREEGRWPGKTQQRARAAWIIPDAAPRHECTKEPLLCAVIPSDDADASGHASGKRQRWWWMVDRAAPQPQQQNRRQREGPFKANG